MLADHEAEPVGRWLNTLGIHAFILRYRHGGGANRHPAPLTDAAHAIRTIRRLAPLMKIDPARIGILGFSAGGHLAATASTVWHAAPASPAMADISARPDLAVLIYPVISMVEPLSHQGSRDNLIGPNPPDDLARLLSPQLQVTPQTPPTFIFHTTNDPVVRADRTIEYARTLATAGIPVEMHLFQSPQPKHGIGLATNDPTLGLWPMLCHHFLANQGFAVPTAAK
jgi:acetyl esterase/lipase